ncbi:MAG: extracellular solute-binding protein [Clostridia bacterium]|nr:extracellular solute-binding protein [Clostridia bacterium]
MLKARKVLSLVLMLAMVVTAMLTGCGQKAAETADTAKEKSQAATEEKKSEEKKSDDKKSELKPVTLSWYVIGKPQKDTELVEQEVEKYLKDKINAKVKINYLDWGAYEQKLNVMIATGEKFDLCFTAGWQLNFQQNASKGAWYDIKDLVDKYGPHLKEKYGKYLSACMTNGKLYGIPYNLSGLGAQGAAYIRKDLADKYKLDVKSLTKYEDLEPFFDQIMKNEKGITPLCMAGGNGTVGLFNIYWDQPDQSVPSLGVKADDQTCTVINTDMSPEGIHDRELLRKWNQKGYIRKDAVSIKDNNIEMKSKKYAAQIGGYVPGWKENYEINWGFETYVAPLSTKPLINTQTVIQSCVAVSKTSENPDRAVMLLDLVNSDPVLLNLLGFGIEGKHYVTVDKSDPVIHIIKQPDGVTTETNGYKTNMEWMFGDPWMLYSDVPNRKDLVEQQKKAVENGIISPINGFVFNEAPVKTQVAQLTAIFQEYKSVWNTGNMDLAKFPTYQERLNKAGLEDVLKEMQKQINEWKANKK